MRGEDKGCSTCSGSIGIDTTETEQQSENY